MNTLCQDGPFELGNGPDNPEQKRPGRRGAIEVFGEGYEVHPQRLQFFECGHEMPQTPAETVKPPYEQDIDLTLPGQLHDRVELRAAVFCPTDTPVNAFRETELQIILSSCPAKSAKRLFALDVPGVHVPDP